MKKGEAGREEVPCCQEPWGRNKCRGGVGLNREERHREDIWSQNSEEEGRVSPSTQGGLSIVTLAPFSPCRPSGPGVPAGP